MGGAESGRAVKSTNFIKKGTKLASKREGGREGEEDGVEEEKGL